MFTRNELKKERLRLRKEITEQLWQLRQNKKLTIKEVSALSKIPPYFIESLELFGLMSLPIIELQRLANFYDKYVKIRLVNKEDL